MANSSLQEQIDDLNDTIQQAQDVLEGAYAPETSRSDAIDAISQALDILSGEEVDEDDEDED